jgi:RHS repeat-associated protein
VWNGWLLIAKLTVSGSTNTLASSYYWGLDLSGSAQGAGGVGGLLMTCEAGSGITYLPLYDAKGNVHGMIKASDGTLAAAYEYDAFGRTLRAEGTYATGNSFRFSTKYTDEETGLVCYGHRYYSPSLGRFINRDPIGEMGGLNLYAFVGNNPVNQWDYLGLDDDYTVYSDGCVSYVDDHGVYHIECPPQTTVEPGDMYRGPTRVARNPSGGGGSGGGGSGGSGPQQSPGTDPNKSPCAGLQAQRAKINTKLGAINNAITRTNGANIPNINAPAAGSTLDKLNTGYNYDSNATAVSSASSVTEAISNALSKANVGTGMIFTGFGIVGISNDFGQGSLAAINGQTGEAVSRLSGGTLGLGTLLGGKMVEQGIFGAGAFARSVVPVTAVLQLGVFALGEVNALSYHTGDLNATQQTIDQFLATQTNLVNDLTNVDRALKDNHCK